MQESSMNIHGKEYVICMYIRISSSDDDLWYGKDESNSITNQRKLIRRYIMDTPELSGCTVIEKCDDGISGTDFSHRQQFMEMIEMVKQQKIDCIIIKDFSRFGRDYIELGFYLEQLLPLLGVRLISINDFYDSSKLSAGDTGGLDVAFKNLVNDFYARETSKKRRIAWQRSAEKGYYCAPKTLYGYKRSKNDRFQLEIDPEAAQIVREIFDMKVAGMGTTGIARNLNDRNIPCPSEFDKQSGSERKWHSGDRKCYWSADAVECVIRNEQYTGTVVNLKTQVNRVTKKQEPRPVEEWVKVENKHEAIVSYTTYLKAVSSLKQHGVKVRKNFERKIYFCGCCGRQLKYPGKGSLYCCVKRYKTESECDGVGLVKKEADAILLNEIKAHLSRYLVSEQHRDKSIGKQEPELSAEEQMQTVQKAIEVSNKAWMMLYEKYKDGEISREELVQQKAVHTAELEKLQGRLQELQEQETKSFTENAIIRQRQAEAEAFIDETELTEELKERYIRKVSVYPGGLLQVEWNFDVDLKDYVVRQAG